MKRALPFFFLLLAPAAMALDASIPDASAGMGGADMTSEENEMRDPCLSSRECERGFVCTDGRCTPAPIRNASGCGGGMALATLPLALGLLVRSRKHGF
ncbi:MAG: hypothetical protein MUC96_36025 [Myxococcaceae bacterium]|jgi:hypothetical protein|nr:hypothetical protein [Myxococcaceae bacterium]